MDTESNTRFKGVGDEMHADAWKQLPNVDPEQARRPQKYVASPDLAAAVNVALTLGMPLLLTGEPGSGKSQLAYRLAWELGFPNPEYSEEKARKFGASYSEPKHKPMKFVVKSTTEARDLFYTFDTVGRFHAAQVQAVAKKNRGSEAPPAATDGESVRELSADAVNFIDYQALGLAIIRAKGLRNLHDVDYLAPRHREKLPADPIRTVVLIDEIDKAPRDVPNDILAEIEDMNFTIPELGRREVRLEGADQQFRPVIIITSNSERDLPEAFLRRCVYYHVPFPAFDAPGPGITVRQIVTSRMTDRFQDEVLNDALRLFRFVREKEGDLKGKPPSIAELLNWLEHLHREFFASTARRPMTTFANIPFPDLVRSVQQILLKSKEDQEQTETLITGWEKG